MEVPSVRGLLVCMPFGTLPRDLYVTALLFSYVLISETFVLQCIRMQEHSMQPRTAEHEMK